MTGDEIKILWQKEYWLLHGLSVIPYKFAFDHETEPAFFDAWWKGRQN